jgi:catalase
MWSRPPSTRRHIVPGIGFSPDKMLQGRLFSYGDAQRYRLGVNHHQIPVNAARCPVHTVITGTGPCASTGTTAAPGYEPNSEGQWPSSRTSPSRRWPWTAPPPNWDFREDDDDYFTQPGLLFRLMTKDQQQALFENTARAMGDAPMEIKIRHIGNCRKADRAYGEGVAKALGIALADVPD